MKNSAPRRVAVVHEWLLDFAGSERVLAEILACFPDADLFTLVDRMSDADRAKLGGRKARTTFLQRAPGIPSKLGYYLPLMPLAVEQIDVTGYDLVISSSHAVAKGVIVAPDALHVSYVHSPMRYAWDLQFEYLRGEGMDEGLRGAVLRLVLHRLRAWDRASAAGVDAFIANSGFVARRVLKAYRREAQVIHPPVDIEFFRPGDGARGDEYLAVSRLMAYKRVDLLVDAFARLPERRLVVVGDGPARRELERRAPPNVRFLGWLAPEAMRERLQRARAFLFAAVEDFGIAPVEALACGTPVIALGRGGAAEIVAGLDAEAPTGVLFSEQTVDSVIGALRDFRENEHRFTPGACRARAEYFSAARFRSEFTGYVEQAWSRWRRQRAS